MKSRAPLICLMLVLGGFVLADTRSEIQKRYEGMAKCHVKRDSAALMSFLTKDYVNIDKTGKKQKRAEYEKALKVNFEKMGSRKIKVSKQVPMITKLTTRGETTTVEVTFTAWATAPNPTTKKTAGIIATVSSRDVWVNQKGVWLLKTSTGLGSKITVDGRTLPEN